MTLPQIPSLDLGFITHLGATAEFKISPFGSATFITTKVDGWTVGYEHGGRRIVAIDPDDITNPPFVEIAGNSPLDTRRIAFAVIASLRLAADPVAAAAEWLHVMVQRHDYTVGLGMAHLALGTELYHEAYGRWEDEDNARRDAQTATA